MLANASLVQLQEPTGVEHYRFMKHSDGTTQNVKAKTRLEKTSSNEMGLNVQREQPRPPGGSRRNVS
jgi:hypothetical protein